MSKDYELRCQIIDTCRWLRQQGLVFGTWGNISVRMDDGNIMITPSKVDYDQMVPEDMVVLSPDGEVVSGHRLSTSEREIHLGVMRKRPDINAIIHMHSTYAMACAARNEAIPPFSEEICQLIGGEIPLTHTFVPSADHKELGRVTVESVTEANAILLRNHGPMCFGRTLEEAKVTCQVLEKSCKIFMHLRAAGDYSVVPEEHVLGGRNYFLHSYGKT